MKRLTKTTLVLAAASALFTGCSQQEMALANSLAGGAMGSSGSSNVGATTVANMSSSPAAQRGFAQSQAIGAQMMNPAVLGVGAVGTAISEKNAAKNREGFSRLTELAVNGDRANNSMQGMLVRAYNQKHGTCFRSFTELQDHAKVEGYNKEQGTQFKTLAEVREDYNQKNGTNFQTDQELRAYIAANR